MIAAFFSKFGMTLMAVALVAVLTIAGLFYWQLSAARQSVAKLETQVSNLKAEVIINKIKAVGMKAALDKVEETNDILSEKLKSESAIEKDIDNVKDEDDAEMSPVLRRTLDSVDRMFYDPKN